MKRTDTTSNKPAWKPLRKAKGPNSQTHQVNRRNILLRPDFGPDFGAL